jgi:hypothetical protein
MEDFLNDIIRFISPLANSDFVGAIYIITAFMLATFTGMPIFIRLSLALPIFMTAIIFITLPNTIPVPYEQVVLVRISHLIFMLALIINAIFYAIAKKKRKPVKKCLK